MSGYLTHLAARSLNVKETIQPRLASRFELPRQITAPAADELGESETTPAEPVSGRKPSSGALERQIPAQRSDPVSQATATVHVPSNEPLLSRAAPRPGSSGENRAFATAMMTDTTRFGKRHDLESPASQTRPPVESDRRRSKLTQPDGLQHSSNSGSANHIQTDEGKSEDGNRREQSLRSLVSGQFRPRIGQEHHQTEPVMAVRRSKIVPSLGLPASQPRMAPTMAEPQRPIVRVSIGRIEVRAIMPTPAIPEPKREQARPSLSLQEYLTQRPGGPR